MRVDLGHYFKIADVIQNVLLFVIGLVVNQLEDFLNDLRNLGNFKLVYLIQQDWPEVTVL